MSSSEEFNLRWNNHLNTISQLLGEFLNNKSLCDVTLSAEGQTVSCHRVILAACSTYFQGIFSQVGDKGLVVMIKDAKFIDLKSLVDFMYYGEVSVEHDRLNSLLRTAESLKVKGLADEKKKEERLHPEPSPQSTHMPQKRILQSSESMAPKRVRMAASHPAPPVVRSNSLVGGDGGESVSPKHEVVELVGEEDRHFGNQDYSDGKGMEGGLEGGTEEVGVEGGMGDKEESVIPGRTVWGEEAPGSGDYRPTGGGQWVLPKDLQAMGYRPVDMPMIQCEFCSYKSAYTSNMKRHRYLKHLQNVVT